MLLRKFLILSFFAITVSASQLIAQSYNTTLGLRMGNDKTKRTLGLTLQQRILKKVTIEGIIQTDFNRNTMAHGMIEQHHAFITKRFNFYFGAGFGFGVEESELIDPTDKTISQTYGNFTMGTDLVAGLEFTLLSYNFSLDYKPNFNLLGREPWYQGQMGFSARRVLIKNISKEKRERQKARKKKKKTKAKSKQ